MKQKLVNGRDRLRTRPAADFAYRSVVAAVGLAVLGVGVLAIPYPGPGWAIVFLGLGILATEFIWAKRLLAFAKSRYDAVMAWFKEQGVWTKLAGVAFTTAVVLATLWVVGALGWMSGLIGLEWRALESPIGVGA